MAMTQKTTTATTMTEPDGQCGSRYDPAMPGRKPRSTLPLLRSRDALFRHLCAELPGWDAWLWNTGEQVRQQHCEVAGLRSAEQVWKDLEPFMVEFIDAVGARHAEQAFRPFALETPPAELGEEHPGAEPYTPVRIGVIPGHDEWFKFLNDKGALPSRMLIGLLGAAAWLRHPSRPAGRPAVPRREQAIPWVEAALVPYVLSKVYCGPLAGQPVVPPHHEMDGWAGDYRTEPLEFSLLAQVVVWLAAPAPYDKEYDPEPGGPPPAADVLEVAKSAIDTIAADLRDRALTR